METPNLNYITDLADGSQEFINEIIQIFKKELVLEIEIFKNAISNSNFKEASEIVHKLKNKISLLSLEKSYYIAQDFENNLKNNSNTLQQEFEDILTLMNDYVKTL
jgi:HPt (histidine-containing phosphotransfer) domain-containing protein